MDALRDVHKLPCPTYTRTVGVNATKEKRLRENKLTASVVFYKELHHNQLERASSQPFDISRV